MPRSCLFAVPLALFSILAGCAEITVAREHDEVSEPEAYNPSKPEARECDAEAGSQLDIASEPSWGLIGNYVRWTDEDGCAVRVDVLSERQGLGFCGWEDTWMIYMGRPLGAKYTSPEDVQAYIRDPNGVYEEALAKGFDADAKLPKGAKDTGYRRDDVELWRGTNGDDAIYLVSDSGVERWPEGAAQICL